jgi:hypothetical protein
MVSSAEPTVIGLQDRQLIADSLTSPALPRMPQGHWLLNPRSNLAYTLKQVYAFHQPKALFNGLGQLRHTLCRPNRLHMGYSKVM